MLDDVCIGTSLIREGLIWGAELNILNVFRYYVFCLYNAHFSLSGYRQISDVTIPSCFFWIRQHH